MKTREYDGLSKNELILKDIVCSVIKNPSVLNSQGNVHVQPTPDAIVSYSVKIVNAILKGTTCNNMQSSASTPYPL